jgi:hypothetical protein
MVVTDVETSQCWLPASRGRLEPLHKSAWPRAASHKHTAKHPSRSHQPGPPPMGWGHPRVHTPLNKGKLAVKTVNKVHGGHAESAPRVHACHWALARNGRCQTNQHACMSFAASPCTHSSWIAATCAGTGMGMLGDRTYR